MIILRNVKHYRISDLTVASWRSFQKYTAIIYVHILIFPRQIQFTILAGGEGTRDRILGSPRTSTRSSLASHLFRSR